MTIFRVLSLNATLGLIIGALDFFVFEMNSDLEQVIELVFYKPRFLSLSPLGTQVWTYVFLAVLFWTFLFLAYRIFRLRILFSRIYYFISGGLFLTVCATRVYKNTENFSSQVFGCISILVVLTLIAIYQKLAEPQKIQIRSASLIFIYFLAWTSILFVSFAPAIYSLHTKSLPREETSVPRRPNVILVILDTVRADRISYAVGDPGLTPNVARVAEESARFSFAFSPAPWTLPAHASIFTGLYPSQHQADWGHMHLDSEHQTLAEILGDFGYRTVGITENPVTSATFGFSQGFQEYHEVWRTPPVERALSRAWRTIRRTPALLEYSRDTVGLFKRWMSNNTGHGQPVLVFLNFMAGHLPNYPRPGLTPGQLSAEQLRRIEPVNIVPERYYIPKYHLRSDEMDLMKRLYDGEIAYLDLQIREIDTFLKDTHMVENSIFVITADHGENFGEHGLIEHQFCIYNTLIHVPLLIRYPGIVRPQEIQSPVSTASILTTVLDLARIPLEASNNFESRNLFDQGYASRGILTEYANPVEQLEKVMEKEGHVFDYSNFDHESKSLILDNYKFIWLSDGRCELYSLIDDFDEFHDRSRLEVSRVEEISRALTHWVKGFELVEKSKEAPLIDQATRDALKALGYEQ